MANVIDLSGLLEPPVTLKDDAGREWEFKAPTKPHGQQMMLLYEGMRWLHQEGKTCKACGHTPTEGMPTRLRHQWEELQSREYEEVVFGQERYQEMIDAGVSGPAMFAMARYLVWYWVLSPETAAFQAEAIANQRYGKHADGTDLTPEEQEQTEAGTDPK